MHSLLQTCLSLAPSAATRVRLPLLLCFEEMTVAFCGEGAEVLLCKRNVTLRTAVKRRPVPTRNNALYFCSSSYSVSRRQFAAGLSLLAFLRPAWPLSSFHPQNSVALAIEGDLQRLTHTRSPLDAAVTDKVRDELLLNFLSSPVGHFFMRFFALWLLVLGVICTYEVWSGSPHIYATVPGADGCIRCSDFDRAGAMILSLCLRFFLK